MPGRKPSVCTILSLCIRVPFSGGGGLHLPIRHAMPGSWLPACFLGGRSGPCCACRLALACSHSLVSCRTSRMPECYNLATSPSEVSQEPNFRRLCAIFPTQSARKWRPDISRSKKSDYFFKNPLPVRGRIWFYLTLSVTYPLQPPPLFAPQSPHFSPPDFAARERHFSS